MTRSLDLITPFLSEESEGIPVEISEKLYLFTLRRIKVLVNAENRIFLQNMQKFAMDDFKVDDDGSGTYFFKAGKTHIKLSIVINDTINIVPYIIYDEDKIKDDLEQLLKIDQLLHSILKNKGLQ